MSSNDPNAQSILRNRGFFRLRRRSDRLWFLAGLFSISFSTAVFVYKWKYEPLDAAAVPAEDAAPRPRPVSASKLFAFVRKEKPAVKSEPARTEPSDRDEAPEEPPPPRREAPKPPVALKPVVVKAPEKKKEPAAAPVKKTPAPAPAPVKKAPAPAPAPAPTPAPAVRAPAAAAYEPLTARKQWQGVFDKDGHMNVHFEDYEGQPAVQLTYDLAEGQWVQAVQDVNGDFSSYTRIRFSFRGEGDEGNNVEFKVEDGDGTVVQLFYQGKADVSQWVAVSADLASLRAARPGADGRMDWGRVRRVSLAISGHPWTKGTVWYRGIRFE